MYNMQHTRWGQSNNCHKIPTGLSMYVCVGGGNTQEVSST